MSETPPTYPPLPPANPLLSERVADLEAQIRESGDVAAIAELKSKLAQAIGDRDKALEENANACEILSHHVEPPYTDLPAMVEALIGRWLSLPSEEEIKAALEPFYVPKVVIRADEVAIRVRLTDLEEVSRLLGKIGLDVLKWVGTPDERHDTNLVAIPKSQHRAGGFTPPHSPAKVSPATFGPPLVHDSMEIPPPSPEQERRALEAMERLLAHGGGRHTRRSVLAFPFEPVVKQLSGPPLAYATDGSSGLDLPTSESAQLGAGAGRRFRTGIKIEIPPGYEGQIRPRSSCPKTLEVRFGTIDSDYRGEIQVVIRSRRTSYDLGWDVISPDKPIAQLVICPVAKAKIEQVDALTPTARGEGGFGSTNARPIESLSSSEVMEELEAHGFNPLQPTGRTSVFPPELHNLPPAPHGRLRPDDVVRVGLNKEGHVNRVEVTLYGEGTLKGAIPVVSVTSEKHPIQAAAEQVTATTEELLTARAKAAEATRAYQAAVDEQEDKSKGLAAASRAVNEWSANNRLDFAKAVEIGDAALAAIGLTSYRCEIAGDPPRLRVERVTFAERQAKNDES